MNFFGCCGNLVELIGLVVFRKRSNIKGTSEKPRFFEEFLGRSVCEQVSVLRGTCSRTNWSDDKITEKDGFAEVPKLNQQLTITNYEKESQKKI